jgi:hypothetical protein
MQFTFLDDSYHCYNIVVVVVDDVLFSQSSSMTCPWNDGCVIIVRRILLREVTSPK